MIHRIPSKLRPCREPVHRHRVIKNSLNMTSFIIKQWMLKQTKQIHYNNHQTEIETRLLKYSLN